MIGNRREKKNNLKLIIKTNDWLWGNMIECHKGLSILDTQEID